MMKVKITACLALGAMALTSCAQVQPKSPEEIAVLAVYDGTWEVDAVLTKDNVANFKGYKNVVACGSWATQTWTIVAGEISGTSRSPGHTQTVSGNIAADGSWEILSRTTNGYIHPAMGAITGDQGSGTLVVKWGRGRHCEYEMKVTRAGM